MLTKPQVRLFSANLTPPRSQEEHSQRRAMKTGASAGPQKSGLVGIAGGHDGLDTQGFRVKSCGKAFDGTNKRKPSTTQCSTKRKESASLLTRKHVDEYDARTRRKRRRRIALKGWQHDDPPSRPRSHQRLFRKDEGFSTSQRTDDYHYGGRAGNRRDPKHSLRACAASYGNHSSADGHLTLLWEKLGNDVRRETCLVIEKIFSSRDSQLWKSRLSGWW